MREGDDGSNDLEPGIAPPGLPPSLRYGAAGGQPRAEFFDTVGIVAMARRWSFSATATAAAPIKSAATQ